MMRSGIEMGWGINHGEMIDSFMMIRLHGWALA
jgi:hypothetical protein